jgi:hypothetical protein
MKLSKFVQSNSKKSTLSTRVPRACVLYIRGLTHFEEKGSGIGVLTEDETMEETRYLSYLLRLWAVKSAGVTYWRASLENPTTGDRQGFPNLEALFTYLEWVAQDPSGEKHIPEPRDQE